MEGGEREGKHDRITGRQTTTGNKEKKAFTLGEPEKWRVQPLKKSAARPGTANPFKLRYHAKGESAYGQRKQLLPADQVL